MRALQPISIAERFVASGGYTAVRHDEQWQVHQQPDGALRVRVDLDGRVVGGATWLFELYLPVELADADGTRLDALRYHADGTRLRATYTREGARLHASWGHARGDRAHTTLSLEGVWRLVARPSLLLTGLALGALLGHQAAVGLLVGPGEDGAPTQQAVSVQLGAPSWATVDGHQHRARAVQMGTNVLWLGANGLPLAARLGEDAVALGRYVPGSVLFNRVPQDDHDEG